MLASWGVLRSVDRVLDTPIDGVPRRGLLRISILLHDIGKFGSRTRGKYRFHFMRHEELSGAIIREKIDLGRYGLTPAQAEYVALTSEDHFVLGLMRKRARERGEYDMAFVQSEAFVQQAREIRAGHPDDFVEIGVLFIGDSLAKTPPDGGPERARSQHPVNVAVGSRYLQVVTERAEA